MTLLYFFELFFDLYFKYKNYNKLEIRFLVDLIMVYKPAKL